MQEEINRKNRQSLKSINKGFKLKQFHQLQEERGIIIKHLTDDLKGVLELNKYDKWTALYPHICYLSNYADEEVLNLLKTLGVTKHVTKYFVSYLDFFKSLDNFQETSKYIILYNNIWHYYMNYSSTFIKNQLAYDLGIDLKKDLGKVGRQEQEGRLPNIFNTIHDDLKKQRELLKQETSEFKFPVYDDKLTKTAKKIFNFSHKIDFYNLYKGLFYFNEKIHSEKLIEIEKFSEPDFKCEFYNLLELLLKDRSLLNNSIDTQLNYGLPNSRRFKIKRVERLILS